MVQLMLLHRPATVTTADIPNHSYWVSDCIQFIQLNLQHCQLASALLTKQIAKLSTVVAVIQEPWTNQGQILGLNYKGCSFFAVPVTTHYIQVLLPRKFVPCHAFSALTMFIA